MTQTEFNITNAGESQNTRILKHLTANKGAWVAMPKLSEVSGAYAVHSRISDLRDMGFQIQQENRREGKQIHSFYKLVS